jgi:hypothetical protein
MGGTHVYPDLGVRIDPTAENATAGKYQRVRTAAIDDGQRLSRGSNPHGYPHEPLVSYRINRQLSGWIPPPLVMRAFGAHCQRQPFET